MYLNITLHNMLFLCIANTAYEAGNCLKAVLSWVSQLDWSYFRCKLGDVVHIL